LVASLKSPDLFSERIASYAPDLSPALRRVVIYLDSNRSETLAKSAMELAEQIGTSDATVVRAAQALGFDGLKELKRAIAESMGRGETPADNMVRSLNDVRGNASIAATQVIRGHISALEPLLAGDPHRALVAAIDLLSTKERVAIFGLGPSSHIAEYFQLMMSRMGRPTISITASGKQLADQLLTIDTADALVLLSYGRTYHESQAVMSAAKELRLPVVLLTDSAETKLIAQATVVLHVPRGRAKHVALHGATLVALDAILLGIATRDEERTIASLQKLNRLRDLAKPRK